MKYTIFFLALAALMSCQHTQIQESDKGSFKSLSLETSTKSSSYFSKFSKKQSRSNALNNKPDADPEDGAFLADAVHLMTHNSFAFLDYVDLGFDVIELQEPREGFKDITEEYQVYSGSCKIFEVDDESMTRDYEHLVGAEFTLYDHNREEVNSKVERIVLVYDPYVELPYIAAAFSPSGEEDYYYRYYGWTSRVGATSYPFMDKGSFYEEEANEKVLTKFQNSVEYSHFEEIFAMPDENDYTEIMAHEQEHFNGVKYHVVQFNSIGGCGSLIDNLTAVYTEKNGKLRLIAMDSMDHYFHDLIDIDGDGFPEIFGAEFSSSAIYTIRKGNLEQYKTVDWSIDECPC